MSDADLLKINLFHHGVIDSLLLIHLIVLMEEEFGQELLMPDLDLSIFESIHGITAYVSSQTYPKD